MTPLVSILVPCFNARRHVAAALDSALAQTWQNKEVIVVDDGSTDGSADILQTFAHRGVTIIRQANRGQSAAVNRALAAAGGQYVKFFDADDLIHPDLIGRQLEVLNGSTTSVASAEWGRFYDDDLNTFNLSYENVWRDMDSRDWLVEAWMDARPMMQCALWLIPRPILEKTGGWNERLSLINDFEFFARILCQADKVKFTEGAPVYYRSGIGGSLSGQRSRAAVESACESLLLGTSHLLARRNDERARKACANVLQDFIYTYYPRYPDLRRRVRRRVQELGGSDLQATGPRRFELLRDIVGWRTAKLTQIMAYRLGYRRRRRHVAPGRPALS